MANTIIYASATFQVTERVEPFDVSVYGEQTPVQVLDIRLLREARPGYWTVEYYNAEVPAKTISDYWTDKTVNTVPAPAPPNTTVQTYKKWNPAVAEVYGLHQTIKDIYGSDINPANIVPGTVPERIVPYGTLQEDGSFLPDVMPPPFLDQVAVGTQNIIIHCSDAVAGYVQVQVDPQDIQVLPLGRQPINRQETITFNGSKKQTLQYPYGPINSMIIRASKGWHDMTGAIAAAPQWDAPSMTFVATTEVYGALDVSYSQMASLYELRFGTGIQWMTDWDRKKAIIDTWKGGTGKSFTQKLLDLPATSFADFAKQAGQMQDDNAQPPPLEVLVTCKGKVQSLKISRTYNPPHMASPSKQDGKSTVYTENMLDDMNTYTYQTEGGITYTSPRVATFMTPDGNGLTLQYADRTPKADKNAAGITAPDDVGGYILKGI